MRSQVLAAVLAEAGVIGLIGSLIGLAGGLLAATLIRKLFSAVGLDLPSTHLVLGARTVLIGIGVGVFVTIAAGLLPAIRATRAAPLESLRTSAAPPRNETGRVARLLAALILGAGGLLTIFTGTGTGHQRLEQSAIGAVPLILAVLVAGPLLVTWLAGVVSWPLERRGGIVPELARENVGRNAGRAAISASSLMIGLALVLFVTIYASGLRNSTRRIIARSFVGDLAIQSQDGQSSIPAGATQAAASLPNLVSISALKAAPARSTASIGSTGRRRRSPGCPPVRRWSSRTRPGPRISPSASARSSLRRRECGSR
jgi:putative ABC transport system permease protein